MDARGKALGWIGLIGGGTLSVAANIRSLWLPEYTEKVEWRSLEQHAPSDAGAFLMAIFLPLAALIGVEMVQHWTHLRRELRYGVLGMVTASAMISSFVHIVTVLMWYGQPTPLAVLATVSVDGIMILSGLALFTKASVRPDADTPSVRTAVALSETVSAWTDELPDNWTPDERTPDTIPDTVPDAWTDIPVSPAPVRTPRPRTPKQEPEWKNRARDLIAAGLTDTEIAGKILADSPDTWSTPEAGRKAVSRLR